MDFPLKNKPIIIIFIWDFSFEFYWTFDVSFYFRNERQSINCLCYRECTTITLYMGTDSETTQLLRLWLEQQCRNVTANSIDSIVFISIETFDIKGQSKHKTIEKSLTYKWRMQCIMRCQDFSSLRRKKKSLKIKSIAVRDWKKWDKRKY